MCKPFFQISRKRFWLFLLIIIAAVIAYNKYPLGVKQYKTISIGMPAAEKAGAPTVIAPPYDVVWKSDFYVYAVGDKPMCLGASCGVGGYFVECLGGWLSSYIKLTEEFDYGLEDAGVDTKKHPVITLADKEGKIVGIYPGAKIRNLPFIMRRHRDLVDPDTFAHCSAQLPRWWK